jgi:Flp pilus assembly pilin Flp
MHSSKAGLARLLNRQGDTAAEYAVLAVALIATVGAGAAALAPRLIAALSGVMAG